MEVELSLSEQQDLNQIAEILQIDDDVKALSEKYLKEYKTKSHHQSSNEKTLLTVGSAVLASVKSLSKEQIPSRQIINALKNVSKQEQNTQEFLTVLKQFASQISLPEKVVADIKVATNKFVLAYTLYMKFQEIFNKLDLQSSSPFPNDYFATLKNIGWLIYLDVRSNSTLPNQTGLVQSMFMIFESLTYLICYSPKEVESKLLGKNINKKDEGAIQEAVFELIKLNAKSFEDISNNTKSFKDCVNKLVENKTIQSQSGFEGMFDVDVINTNFKSLEDFYLKNMCDDDLDERFYREEQSRKPPASGRSTPLIKQANNKLNINVNITNEDEKGITRNSYNKPLNYEVSEQMRLGSQLRDVKNSMRTVPASPQIGAMTPQRGMVTATPMSKALENYKWLNEKLKLRKNESGFPPVLDKYLSATESIHKEEIMKRVNSILDCEQGSVSTYDSQIKKQIKDKQHQIINIYFKVFEELLVQEERKTKRVQYSEIIRNDNFHRALIAASIETVFFVNNYTDLSFNMLLELCNINSFEFWRIIASFVKFDSNMPHQLRKHFSDLEVKILLHLAWKKNSPVLNVINNFIQQSKMKKEPKSTGSQESNLEDNSNSTNEASFNKQIKVEEGGAKEEKPFDLTHSQSLFFKRLLHHVAVQICQICEKLSLSDVIAESVWQAIQKVLGDHTLLLVDRHVAQLLLCCIYGVCKALKHPLKFQEIINKYQEIPVFQKDEYSEIVHQVRLNENEKIDLITFYNKVFILEMKNFILSLSQDKNKQGSVTPLAKPIVPPLVPSSPLKEFLSTHLMLGAASQENKATPSMSKFGLTPRTKALYAFGESPGGVLDSINKVTGKRHIDYDESQDPGASKRHAKTPSSIMDKIIGNVGGKESDHSKPLPSKRNLFGTTNPLGVTTKKTNDESSQSQSLLASESSNTSTISLPIPQDGTRSVTSLAGNIEKINMNSGNKE